ncbi:MAG: hypothetical protein SGPRY_003966 [Prymnesium sp.]
MYEQRYNVALSRARDRMVLFRSLRAADITNPDDLKLKTIQFFSRGGGVISGLGGGVGARSGGLTMGKTTEAELCDFLRRKGYRFSDDCSIAGSAAVVEDYLEDRRLCFCLDGGIGATLADWRRQLRDQRTLQRAGWRFHRVWRSSWLVERNRCERELCAALEAASIRPLPEAHLPSSHEPHTASSSHASHAPQACKSSHISSPSHPLPLPAESGEGGHFDPTSALPKGSKRKGGVALDASSGGVGEGGIANGQHKRGNPAAVPAARQADGRVASVPSTGGGGGEGGGASATAPTKNKKATHVAACSASAGATDSTDHSPPPPPPAKKRATPENPPPQKKKQRKDDDPDYVP